MITGTRRTNQRGTGSNPLTAWRWLDTCPSSSPGTVLCSSSTPETDQEQRRPEKQRFGFYLRPVYLRQN